MSTPLDNLKAHLEILRFTRAKISEYTEMADRSKAAIQEAMGESEVGTVEGEPAVKWTHSKVTRLDQKKLKAEHPEVVSAYMTTSEQRRFEVL